MLGRLLLLSQSDVAVNMLPMCRLFAEDNSLQYSPNNILDIEHYLNHYLKILESWSKKWFLKFNPTKTKDVFFTKKHNSVLSKLFFEGYIMEFVLTHRHLGLLLSQNLRLFDYIDGTVTSAFQKLGLKKNI